VCHTAITQYRHCVAPIVTCYNAVNLFNTLARWSLEISSPVTNWLPSYSIVEAGIRFETPRCLKIAAAISALGFAVSWSATPCLLLPFARYCCPCVAMIHKLSKGRLNSPAQMIKIDKSFRIIHYILILGERRGTAINI